MLGNTSPLILVVGLVLLYSIHLPAQCPCLTRPFLEEKEMATEIFIGRILSKEINSRDMGRVEWEKRGTLTGIRNKVRIVQVFKGDFEVRDTIDILTGDSTNPCAYHFDLNQFYLIYSRYQFTNQCRRTKMISSRNDADIKALMGSDSSFNPPPSPFPPRHESSLTEKAYFRYRVFNPIIIPKECENEENEDECIQGLAREVSSYFYHNISPRDIKQIIVLRVYESGEVLLDRVVPKIGRLTKEEEEHILSYIKENWVFSTRGYGELMSNGITAIVLSNESD